jgi:hypothetical protein
MPWVIKRHDGTYRGWMVARDEELRDGEVYVEMAVMPEIGPSLDEQKEFDAKALKALKALKG